MMESPFEWDQGLKVEGPRVLLASSASAVWEYRQKGGFSSQVKSSPGISELSQPNLFLKSFHFSQKIDQEDAVSEESRGWTLSDYFWKMEDKNIEHNLYYYVKSNNKLQ